MADRVYPSTKTNVPAAVAGVGSSGVGSQGGQTISAPPGAVKPQLYNPNRQPYRPQPYSQARRARRKLCSCCCCLFWTILLILILALLLAIAGTAFWVLYRPHSPSFSISNLRLAKLNLTSNTDSTHLTSSMNLTLSTSNPNKKITFFYDEFILSVLSGSNVLIANGSAEGFTSVQKGTKSMKLELKQGRDLDAEEAKSLKSEFKKKKGLAMKVRAETRVRVKIGKMMTKKVTVRVTCEGIHGAVPIGKTPTVASTSESKCTVDLRFNIWKFTF